MLAGEAVAWPPDVIHGAWTDGTHMRAIVVELTSPPLVLPGVAEGSVQAVGPGDPARPVTKGTGSLAPRPARPMPRVIDEDLEEGEPL